MLIQLFSLPQYFRLLLEKFQSAVKSYWVMWVCRQCLFFWIMKNSKRQQEPEREWRQSICAEEGIHQKNLRKTEIKHVLKSCFFQETSSTFGDPLHEVLCIVLEHPLHVFGPHGDFFGLDQHKPFSGGLWKIKQQHAFSVPHENPASCLSGRVTKQTSLECWSSDNRSLARWFNMPETPLWQFIVSRVKKIY